jgi:hypothetical protein
MSRSQQTPHEAGIANYTAVGFITVRRRSVGAPWPGEVAQSFDLVRSTRTGGQPRHRFVKGLGCQREGDAEWDTARFWQRAFFHLRLLGYDTHRMADRMLDKGARPPTLACIEQQKQRFPYAAAVYDDIAVWLARTEQRKAAA